MEPITFTATVAALGITAEGAGRVVGQTLATDAWQSIPTALTAGRVSSRHERQRWDQPHLDLRLLSQRGAAHLASVPVLVGV
jgi:hypothetical protein